MNYSTLNKTVKELKEIASRYNIMAISITEFMQNAKDDEYFKINKSFSKPTSEDFYNAIAEIVDRNGHIGRIPKKHCLHRLCTQCHGNGVKTDGTICVHYISCNCATCTTYSM